MRLNVFGRSFAGRAAHSLYFTMLAELGSVGSVAFLVMLAAVIRRTWKLSRAGDPGLPPGLASGVGAALVSYAACSAFVSAFYYPPFWVLCGFACGMYLPAKQPKPTESPGRKPDKRLTQLAKPAAQAMSANRR
jgi:O-antigen ligase